MTHPNESRVERRPQTGDIQDRKRSITLNGKAYPASNFSPNAFARVLRIEAKARKAAGAGDNRETRLRKMRAWLQKVERAALLRDDPVET